jgi:hypothetical protein
MRNGGRVLLAVQNLYVQIKIRVAILDTKHSVTGEGKIMIETSGGE